MKVQNYKVGVKLSFTRTRSLKSKKLYFDFLLKFYMKQNNEHIRQQKMSAKMLKEIKKTLLQGMWTFSKTKI